MIACTLNHGYPIIHSDILVSADERPETFYVPGLTGNVMEVLPDNREGYPFALKRKVTCIHDRVCFAFAGNLWEGERLLEDLRLYCKILDNVTRDKVIEYLRAYDTEGFDNSFQFCVVIVEATPMGNDATVLYNNRCVVKDVGVFGQLCLLGSGADDFLHATEEVRWDQSTIPQTPQEAVQLNMALIASILSNERVDQRTLNKHWGAGIETLYFDGEKFVTLGQVSFVFNQWFKGGQDDKGHPVPVKVTTYKYIDDYLFIVDVVAARSMQREKEDWIVFDLEEHNVGLFVMAGIEDRKPVDWPKFHRELSFSSTFVGMGYIIIDGDKGYGPGGFHGRNELIVEYQHGNSLRIEIHRSVYERIGSIFG